MTRKQKTHLLDRRFQRKNRWAPQYESKQIRWLCKYESVLRTRVASWGGCLSETIQDVIVTTHHTSGHWQRSFGV